MKYLISLLILLSLGVAVFIYQSHNKINAEPHFVGAGECQSCHQVHHTSFKQTLHPVIFQAITSSDQIQGDFDTPNALVNFKKDEIEFVVGSKWEQVYMRLIDGEYYPFTAKWMITTQKWVPYKVHN